MHTEENQSTLGCTLMVALSSHTKGYRTSRRDAIVYCAAEDRQRHGKAVTCPDIADRTLQCVASHSHEQIPVYGLQMSVLQRDPWYTQVCAGAQY